MPPAPDSGCGFPQPPPPTALPHIHIKGTRSVMTHAKLLFTNPQVQDLRHCATHRKHSPAACWAASDERLGLHSAKPLPEPSPSDTPTQATPGAPLAHVASTPQRAPCFKTTDPRQWGQTGNRGTQEPSHQLPGVRCKVSQSSPSRLVPQAPPTPIEYAP